jgi:trigger factor
MALRNGVVDALVELVEDEAPEAMVNAELGTRVNDLGQRLEQQGATIAQYAQATGQTGEQLLEELRAGATQGVKADLALRAVAESEGLEATEEDIDEQIDRLAERTGMKPNDVRRQLERAEQLPAVRSDIKKSKALEWLVEHAEIVDEEGHAVDRAELETKADSDNDDEAGEVTDTASSSESSESGENSA